MSIRWRQDGRLLCAAKSAPKPGDTYIDDRLHYQLSVISRAIIADAEHETNALWHWVHSDEHHANSGFLRARPETTPHAADVERSEMHAAEKAWDEFLDARGIDNLDAEERHLLGAFARLFEPDPEAALEPTTTPPKETDA